MTEGATAVYIALATALAVWATIAIYLGRVHARLRRLQRDLERMPPGDAPPGARETPPADAPGVAANPVIEREADSTPTLVIDHPLRLMSWLVALQYGNGETHWLLQAASDEVLPPEQMRKR
jgi:hypothetical protein